jgi:hypothetical protein
VLCQLDGSEFSFPFHGGLMESPYKTLLRREEELVLW